MTDWPDDWFRDGPQQAGPNPPGGEAVPSAPGGAATETAAVGPGAPLAGSTYTEAVTQPRGAGGAGSGWPEQPALRTPADKSRFGGRGRGGGGTAGPGTVRTGWRRWVRPKPILLVVAVLLSLALIASVGTYFYLDSKLTRKNVLVDYSGRPTPGAGQNWLITGSDSRQGLTRAQIRRLSTGYGIGGHRSDTIMVLHMPANGGRPVLLSIPRDSYVQIPGYGMNKINAAYSFGGAELLAKTVQNATGLYISHYMGIGFGGFVRVVDAIGGVQICLKAPLVDRAAGLHLHAGCQDLSGAQALGFMRSRHTYASQDLQRIQNQRIFLRALLRKMTSTGVLINPFESYPAAADVVGALTVDQGTSLYQLLKVAFALRDPITTTVPIGNANYVTRNAGDALLWNTAQARQLFTDLRTDRPIPRSLITGSTLPG